MNGVVKYLRKALLAAVVATLMTTTCPVSAATFTPSDVAGLVAAINTANANGESDTINLGGHTFILTAVDNTLDGPNGLPVVGPDSGRALTIRTGIISRDTSGTTPAFRFFVVQAGANLTLENLVLTRGWVNTNGMGAESSGGAILSFGTLSIVASTLFLNQTGGGGGAIYAGGKLSITGSTLSYNWAGSGGGAITAAGPLTIRNCTISGNHAAAYHGGGLVLVGASDGSRSITNSTFAWNMAAGFGGGIYILSEGPTSLGTLASCVIAHNVAQGGPDLLSMSGITTAANNLIRDGADSGLTNGADGNIVGSATFPVEPMLVALASNGGPTLTHALLAGSPAIDRGSNPAGLAYDQRGDGFGRVSGAQADVGAFELQMADLSVAETSEPDPVPAGANLTWTVTVTNAGTAAAETVQLSNTLQASTTFISLSAPAGWSCSTPAVGSNGTVSCSIASFPAGSAAFRIVAAVDRATAAGTVLSNTATATSATADPDSADTTATATATVAGPDFSDGPPVPAVGRLGLGVLTLLVALSGALVAGRRPS